MTTDSLSAADGFVLAMLGMMLLSIGVVALLIFCGLRNAARRDRQVDELLDEVAEEAKPKKTAPAASDAPKAEPWEKDGDWWKK
ncbi:hypothetical protein HQ447_20200 [bacterium]|nr:hypothetical protein [bacterium]